MCPYKYIKMYCSILMLNNMSFLSYMKTRTYKKKDETPLYIQACERARFKIRFWMQREEKNCNKSLILFGMQWKWFLRLFVDLYLKTKF